GGAGTCLRRGRLAALHPRREGFPPLCRAVSAGPGAIHRRLSAVLGASFQQRVTGSISLQFGRTRYYDSRSIDRAFLSYSRNLGRLLSFLARIQRNWQPGTAVTEGFAVINVHLGFLRTGTIDSYATAQQQRTTLAFRQDIPIGTGFGYEVQTIESDDARLPRSSDASLSMRYQAERFQPSVALRNLGNHQEWMVSVAGSVAGIHRSLFLARP